VQDYCKSNQPISLKVGFRDLDYHTAEHIACLFTNNMENKEKEKKEEKNNLN